MKVKMLIIFFLVFIGSGSMVFSDTRDEEAKSTYKRVDMNIGVNKEDRDVGLKRMEMIDKVLSRDLIDRKRELVRTIEKDYNQKVSGLINSIIPALFDTKVFTNINVNFFAPDFDSEVNSSQNVSVSIIMKIDGFDTWAKQNSSEQDALNTLKQVIGNTFKIQGDNISILVVN
jgi:hypothetical protein